MICKKILIVEDDDDIRKQVSKALRMEGYDVEPVANGRLALDYLEALPKSELPGCVILDLMMPEMDGISLMGKLSAQPEKYGEMKILIATAKGSPVDPESVPGAVERIQKPFDLDELYAVVEKHCGKPRH